MNLSALLLIAMLNPNCPYVCLPDPNLSKLEANLLREKFKLERCPRMYVTRCINPAKAKIESLKQQIESLKRTQTGGK